MDNENIADTTGTIEPANIPLPNGDIGLADTRDSKGRFLKGNPGGPGNPNARNVAAWRQALADSISSDDVAEVVGVLMANAKSGEAWAVKEMFDRCFGKPHVQLELSANVESARQYSEFEKAEAHRLAELMLMDSLGDRRAGGVIPHDLPASL